jgi:hypothetical protein
MAPLSWQEPLRLEICGRYWEFVPVILKEMALGVAFRGNRERLNLLEIASPVKLRERLATPNDGQIIQTRLLSGLLLQSAAEQAHAADGASVLKET